MTYTPERQLFPPGTKVKAEGYRGQVYTGIVASAGDRLTTGELVGNRPEFVKTRLCAFWDDGPGTPVRTSVQGVRYSEYVFTKLEDAPKQASKSQTQETAPMQSIKSAAESLRRHVKPYEKYLVAAAVLLALDHFVLKGAMTNRIERLAQSLADRLAAMVDGLIAKIGGE